MKTLWPTAKSLRRFHANGTARRRSSAHLAAWHAIEPGDEGIIVSSGHGLKRYVQEYLSGELRFLPLTHLNMRINDDFKKGWTE